MDASLPSGLSTGVILWANIVFRHILVKIFSVELRLAFKFMYRVIYSYSFYIYGTWYGLVPFIMLLHNSCFFGLTMKIILARSTKL